MDWLNDVYTIPPWVAMLSTLVPRIPRGCRCDTDKRVFSSISGQYHCTQLNERHNYVVRLIASSLAGATAAAKQAAH